MKLYYFCIHGYGEEYSVMAENKLKAFEYLLKYFEDQVEGKGVITRSDGIQYDSCGSRNFKEWSKVIPEDPLTYPEGYSIIECSEGEIIQTEVC